MSFIDDIVDFGSTVVSGFTGSGIGPTLARTAALGLVLNQVTKSVSKDNNTTPSTPTESTNRVQQSPDTTKSIPVVYGSTFVGGIVTDAYLTDSNQTMWFCMTIAEKTGTLMSTNEDSVISFQEIWLDNQKLTFQSDGITVESAIDEDGNVNDSMAGLIQVFCFNNGGSSPVVPAGYTNGSLGYAHSIMPNWSAEHDMSNLVFCLIKVTYDSENKVTGLGTMEFKLSNTLTLPGDVVYDYMTNTRYGAGIDPSEIYSV